MSYGYAKGDIVRTPCGKYEIIACVYDDCCTDTSISLYVGRADDGHCDLIADDNASAWVVGNDDDDINADQFRAIGHRYNYAIDDIIAIDHDLADYLIERHGSAIRHI